MGGSWRCAGAAVPPAGRLTRGAIPCTSPWPWTGAAGAAFSPAGNSDRRRGSSLLRFLPLLVSFTGENGSGRYLQIIYFEDSRSTGVRGLLLLPWVYLKLPNLWGFSLLPLGKYSTAYDTLLLVVGLHRPFINFTSLLLVTPFSTNAELTFIHNKKTFVLT